MSSILDVFDEPKGEMYPFLKKYKSFLMDVAASNTRLLLHCSPPGLGRGSGPSVGSSGSG